MTTRSSPGSNPRLAALALALAVCAAATPAGAAAQEASADEALPTTYAARSPAQAEVDFTFGLVAYHDGDLETAERRLRDAVHHEPEHGGAWWALGMVHLSRGAGGEARDAFRRALDARLPPPVPRSEVRAAMERAQGPAAPGVVPLPEASGLGVVVQGLPRWEARVGAGIGDDSNPAWLPDGLVAPLPGGGLLESDASETVAAFDLRLGVHPFYDRGGWSLELGADGRQSLHDELDVLDLRRVRGFAHLAWGGDPAGFLVGPLGASRVPLGNRRLALLLQAAASDDELDGEPFASAVEAAAALTFRESPRTATQLDLAWRDEELDQPGRELFDPQGRFAGDREETAVGLSQWLWSSRRSRYLRLGGRVADRDAGGDFDSEVTGASAELSLPLSPRAFLLLAGTWEREEYDRIESNPLFGSVFGDAPREDEWTRVSAALSLGLTSHLWLTLRGSWLDRDVALGAADELIDFDGDRTVAAASLRWFVDGGRVER